MGKYTPWGTYGKKSTRINFSHWLKSLNSADILMRSDGCITFYQTLPMGMDKKIKARLKKVDPKGYRKMCSARRVLGGRRARAKKIKPPKPMNKNDMTALIRVEELDVTDMSIVKYVPIEGIRNVLAICLASGYGKEEVAAQIHITVPELNGIVTDESIKKARRVLPEVITAMADGKVLRDLMEGDVTENTARADLIASRRRKTFMEQGQEGRESRKDHEELEKMREEKRKSRFGVDRRKGKVIDVEEEE